MIVITMTDCPPKLRGDLTKWLFEIDTGVYVGNVSARVREALWERVCGNIGNGRATMVYSAKNEQHLEFRAHNTSWKIRDFDGIKIMMRPNKPNQTEELPKGFSNAAKRRLGAKRSVASNNKERVFLDIETTGLSVEKDDIIEIAALVADNSGIISSWNSLIKINAALPSQISKLTGITDEMLKSGAELSEALQKLGEIVNGREVVCFNRKFDISFLENAFAKKSLEFPISKVTDVLLLVRKRIWDIENYKLNTIAEHFKIPCEASHRALADCETLYKVFLKLNEI